MVKLRREVEGRREELLWVEERRLEAWAVWFIYLLLQG
jgi:hypothetical protein